MKGQNERMPQSRKKFYLAIETFGIDGLALIALKNLERYRSLMPNVVREIDGRHSAAAELALDAKTCGEIVAKIRRNAVRVRLVI